MGSRPNPSGESQNGYVLIAIAFVVAFFWAVVTGREVFYLRDVFYLDYPNAYYAVAMIRKGVFPWWDPLNGCGMPFFTVVSHRLLYPLFWFLFLCPLKTLAVAFGHFLIWHYVLAAAGMYAFLKAHQIHPFGCLAGAIIFAMNGYMVMMTSNPLYLISAAWLPLSMLCALKLHHAWQQAARPRLVRLYLVTAMLFSIQFFHGETQGFYLNAVVAGGYLLVLQAADKAKNFKRPSFYVLSLGCVLLVLMIVAVQLLPFWDYFQVTPRARSAGGATLYDFSFHPLRLITHLVPYFFGNLTAANPLWGNYLNFNPTKILWSVTAYSGMLTVYLLAVAVFARPRKASLWVPLLAGALLAACGRDYYVYDLLRSLLPFFERFRYPEKMLPFYYFPLAVICAWGADALATADSRPARERILRATAAVTLAAAAAVIGFFFAPGAGRVLAWVQEHASLPEAARVLQSLRPAVGTSFATLVLFGLLGLAVCRAPGRVGAAGMAVIMMINLADVYIHNRQTDYTIPAGALAVDQEGKPPLADLLQQRLLPANQWRYLVDPGIDWPGIPGSTDTFVRAYFLTYKHLLKPRSNVFFGLNSFVDKDAFNNARIQHLGYQRLSQDFAAIVQLFNIRYFIGSDQEAVKFKTIGDVAAHVRSGLLEKVQDLDVPGVSLYRVARSLPRCFLAFDWQPADDETQLADRVFNPQNIFERVTVERFRHLRKGRLKQAAVQVPRPSQPGRGLSEAGVLNAAYGPSRVTLRVDTPAGAMLVLNQYPAPGWQVRVDGREMSLYHIDYLMMGVYLQAGQHSVSFHYRPNYFLPSLILTIGGLGLWGLGMALTRPEDRGRLQAGGRTAGC